MTDNKKALKSVRKATPSNAETEEGSVVMKSAVTNSETVTADADEILSEGVEEIIEKTDEEAEKSESEKADNETESHKLAWNPDVIELSDCRTAGL